MVEVILVRHGETAGNIRKTALGITDLPLNENGIRQAARAAELLAGETIAAIYTSPLSRAKTTAEIVAEPHSIAPQSIEGLAERRYGIWENIAVDDIKERFPEAYAAWQQNLPDYQIPGGETARENFHRVKDTVSAILTRHDSGKIIIVSHLGCIRNLIAHFLGKGVENAWDYNVRNGSVTKLQIKQGKNAVLTAFDII